MSDAPRSDRSVSSDRSRIRPSGGYRDLRSFQVTTIICLIHQANYLLDQQIRALEAQFVEGGGYTEQLAAARVAHRRKADQPDRSNPPDQTARPAAPHCRACGNPMILRTAKQGPRAGSQFWGCSGYPECKSTQPI